MANSGQRSLIPVYTTKGDAEAFLSYPYLFNHNGEWIGWVTPSREVYSVLGQYVGTLTSDPRIVRKRATNTLKPRLQLQMNWVEFRIFLNDSLTTNIPPNPLRDSRLSIAQLLQPQHANSLGNV